MTEDDDDKRLMTVVEFIGGPLDGERMRLAMTVREYHVPLRGTAISTSPESSLAHAGCLPRAGVYQRNRFDEMTWQGEE